MAAAVKCTPAASTDTIFGLKPYDADDAKCPPCSNPTDMLLASPKFFGKDDKGKPILVVLDHKQFKIAQGGIIGTSVVTSLLVVGLVVCAVKLWRRRM